MDKLSQARAVIDEVDAQMAQLFCRRMENAPFSPDVLLKRYSGRGKNVKIQEFESSLRQTVS